METVTDFIFLGSKITADGDCIHEIKRCFLLGRNAMGWDGGWGERAADPPAQKEILTWEGREVEAYLWTDLRIDRGRESYLLDSEFSLAQCLVQFVDLI